MAEETVALRQPPAAEEIEGPHPTSKNSLRLLAERIEGLISQEQARWISSRRQQDDEELKTQRERSGD